MTESTKWYLTIGSGILDEFPNKKAALNHVKDSLMPFHQISKNHYLMGNMHLLSESEMEYIE